MGQQVLKSQPSFWRKRTKSNAAFDLQKVVLFALFEAFHDRA